MNKAHFEFHGLSSQSQPLVLSSIRQVDWPVPEGLPVNGFVQLFTEVENALNDIHGLIVQFVSITEGCGGESVGFEMALAAASVLDRDILVLNAADSLTGFVNDAPSLQEPHILQNGNGVRVPFSLEAHMIKTNGHGLYVINLHDVCESGRASAISDELLTNLQKMSPLFDMIVVIGPPTDSDPFSLTFSRHADANILVVEAEQTSRSATAQIQQTLVRCGRPLIGAVLNNKLCHIPQWFTRWQ